MKKYSAIIIDDDQDNTSLLKNYLKRHCPSVDVKDTSTNVEGAIRLYQKYIPEILFLDIQLNNETIFSFIDKVDDLSSQLIFISSHNKFAIKTIQYKAIDFVIKPIQINDLIAAVNRAVQNIELSKNNTLEETKKLKLIGIPSMDAIEIIKLKDLIYCEADGRYTNFYLTNNVKKTSCRNLGEYEEIFSKTDSLFRIHYKYIVNLDKLININKTGGNYCQFENNISLPIAARRQQELSMYLKLK